MERRRAEKDKTRKQLTYKLIVAIADVGALANAVPVCVNQPGHEHSAVAFDHLRLLILRQLTHFPAAGE